MGFQAMDLLFSKQGHADKSNSSMQTASINATKAITRKFLVQLLWQPGSPSERRLPGDH